MLAFDLSVVVVPHATDRSLDRVPPTRIVVIRALAVHHTSNLTVSRPEDVTVLSWGSTISAHVASDSRGLDGLDVAESAENYPLNRLVLPVLARSPDDLGVLSREEQCRNRTFGILRSLADEVIEAFIEGEVDMVLDLGLAGHDFSPERLELACLVVLCVQVALVGLSEWLTDAGIESVGVLSDIERLYTLMTGSPNKLDAAIQIANAAIIFFICVLFPFLWLAV